MAALEASSSGKIPCNKCKAENEPDRNRCRTCGAHLYILCKRCKHKVARFLDACTTCQSPLHKDGEQEKGLLGLLKRKAPQITFLLVLLVLLAYLFEIF